MTLFLYNMPIACMGLIVVGLTLLSVLLGYAGVTRFKLIRIDAEQRAMALGMVSIITTINSLLVAFAAVSVWDAYNDADRTVAAEATCADGLARNLAVFGSPAAEATGRALRAYLQDVVEREWPAMQQALLPDRQTALRFDAMFALANRIDPATPRQVVLLGEILSRTNEMVAYRQQRLMTLQVTMPGTLWAVMIIVSWLSFALLYVLPPTPFYVALIATWAATLGLTFFFILAVDRPYAGEVSVSAAPLRKALDALTAGQARPAEAPRAMLSTAKGVSP
ncbi:DUF4239 domain-containing protein [Chitinimonas arctica]|uniref:DUF4239 domain-containing protein n=1 Tax=Chitinimonas arctica TaxID=2594795 RepID=A0A516SJP1_9NEIS|nr:DUF4239 domain-containing protein [Chitinimonas arctica]QDQ28381.1 DUF4239 domain-containing protein [Chitinimonas arctica]